MTQKNVADEVIYALMERVRGGEFLRDILEAPDRPISRAGFYKRVNADPDMKATWRQIIADSGDSWAEKADAIARDVLENEKLDPKRAAIAIDHFRWRAEKANPQRYGQRQTLEHTGDQGSYLDALQRAQPMIAEAKAQQGDKDAKVIPLPVKGGAA